MSRLQLVILIGLLAAQIVFGGTYSIEGAQIMYNDKPVRLAGGVNAMHTFSLGSTSDYSLLTKWNVVIVREFIANLGETPLTGQWATKTSNGQWLWPLQSIVDSNRANGMVTILCPFYWVNETTLEVTEFSGKYPSEQPFYNAYKIRMREIAEQFKNDSSVWIEVWNEPYPWDNSKGYKNETWLSDHIHMVDNLRNVIGFDNIIVVQGNGQGQLEEALLSRGADLLKNRHNILFDLHGYEKWMMGSDATLDAIVSRLSSLKAAGFAIIFGECGVINQSGLMSGFIDFLEGMSSGDIPTLAWLWKYSSSDNNALLNSSGLPNNNGNLFWGSQFKRFLAERALSTSFPTGSPTKLPAPAPTARPTISPTTQDTFTVDFTLTLTTYKSSLTSSETSDLQSAVATAVGVTSNALVNFIVVIANTRRRLLSSYTWEISFKVVTTLGSTTASSSTAFVNSVKSSLESTTFASNVAAALSSSVSVTIVSAVLSTRRPSPAPTAPPSRPASMLTTLGTQNATAFSASAKIISVVAAASVLAILLFAALIKYRRGRQPVNKPLVQSQECISKSNEVVKSGHINQRNSELKLIERRKLEEAARCSSPRLGIVYDIQTPGVI